MTLPSGTLEAVSTRLVQSAIQNAIAQAGGVSAERASVVHITETVTYCDVAVTHGALADAGACPVPAGVTPLWRFLVRVDLSASA